MPTRSNDYRGGLPIEWLQIQAPLGTITFIELKRMLISNKGVNQRNKAQNELYKLKNRDYPNFSLISNFLLHKMKV